LYIGRKLNIIAEINMKHTSQYLAKPKCDNKVKSAVISEEGMFWNMEIFSGGMRRFIIYVIT
jgi:hypothetical protein